MPDVWSIIAEAFPGVRLESEVQGWAFLERFEEGLEAYAAMHSPSPKDDRWAGVCQFHLLRDLEALELLYRSANRGEEGAHVYLSHVLPFVDRAEEAWQELEKVNLDALTNYDLAFYYRILSLREETNGNMTAALRAAEEAWRRVQGAPEYAVLAPSVLAQLAVLHGRIGRSQRALWFLERGLIAATGMEHSKVRLRRAAVLVNLGRYREAEVELDSLELSIRGSNFQPEKLWLLAEIAWASGNIPLAVQRYSESIKHAQELQSSYEEFLCRLPLICIYGVRGDYARATEHLARAQLLISDKSDRLTFRFREVLLNYWMGNYQPTHALQELEGLVVAFGEMGLLQEQAAARLHLCELKRRYEIGGWERELNEIHAMSISLQNPALLAREWTLVPELREIAHKTHPRIAGQAPAVLQVFTLGNESLVLNGKVVHIPLRRAIEVLAYFLEHKAVSLRKIMGDVFPDEKPSAAKSYFHQFRHQLRESIGKVEIEFDAEAKLYRLRSEIDIVWDVGELRAGRVMGETGSFIPSSGNDWVYHLDQTLDTLRSAEVTSRP